MVDICSIWSYDDIKMSGKLSRLHGKFLSIYTESVSPLTMDQAIRKFKEKFGDAPYKTHHGVGSRISELTEMGFLEKCGITICEFTNKRVNLWRWTGRKEPLPRRVVEKSCPHCFGRGRMSIEEYYKPMFQEQKLLF